MKYKRYPKYKDSGVEWIGEIPEGWEVVRLKHNHAQVIAKSKAQITLLEEKRQALITATVTGKIDVRK